jgi:hypothetical protein
MKTTKQQEQKEIRTIQQKAAKKNFEKLVVRQRDWEVESLMHLDESAERGLGIEIESELEVVKKLEASFAEEQMELQPQETKYQMNKTFQINRRNQMKIQSLNFIRGFKETPVSSIPVSCELQKEEKFHL